ncbi:MAG: MarC family protein [Rhizobiaceae bacterium]
MLDFDELSNWPEYVKVFVGVLALVPPPIIVPLYLGVMAGRSMKEKNAAALVGGLGFLITTVAFTFLGEAILGVFGITLGAFRLAGGFLLLMIAIDMLRSDPHIDASGESRGGSAVAVGIVPITIPSLAGPGAISAVVLFASEHDGLTHRILVSIVLAGVALLVYVMLRAAAYAEQLFTKNVQLIFNKVMGLLVAAIAFEFMMDGLAAHFPELVTVH